MERVTAIYQRALTHFFTKRKSALTGAMFHDLFRRFPVSGADCGTHCLLWLQSAAVILRKTGRETLLPLLWAFQSAVRFPRIFACSSLLTPHVLVAALQKARNSFVVWIGMLGEE